jgi:hypothetical protein
MEQKKVTLKDTLKSIDTEEWFDLIFYRKIGYAWALLFRKLHITPNVVTIAAIFIGATAGVLFYYDNIYLSLVGMFLLVWANSFDSADGQLARMTGQYSRIGRILDGACGDVWFIIIYFALGWRLRDFDGVAWWIVYPLGVAAGYCHILQAQIADCYRTLHLFFVNGRAKSELEEVETLKADYAKLTWRENWFQKIVLIFYINHTASQQFFSPQMREMRRRINTLYPNTDVPKSLAEEYRQMSRPLLKYTNILTFNTRIAVLFLALLVDEVWIYFLFDITVMNILLIYMIVKYEKVCKRFNSLLDKE